MTVKIQYNAYTREWQVESGELEYGSWIEGSGGTLEIAAADYQAQADAKERR